MTPPPTPIPAARGRSLEDLGAQVAHEIKNPVAAVRGLIELLREDATEPRQQRRLEVAHGEVARIERILRDYLSFARPLTALTVAPADLADVARDVTLVLEGYAARRGVALAGEGPPLPARVDAPRVKEALLNLALNAIEATPPGGHVTVTWGPRGDDAVLAVRDTGAGLDADALARASSAAPPARSSRRAPRRSVRPAASRRSATTSASSTPRVTSRASSATA